MEFDALTAGVKPGGLNNKNAIKILVCYIVDMVKAPITQEQLERSIVITELANLFEFGDALSRLEKQQLLNFTDGAYTITKSGHEVADSLHTQLPFTVREQAYKAAVNCLEYSRIKAFTDVDVKEAQGGGFNVYCTLKDEFSVIFETTMFFPEKHMADYAKKRFFNGATKIYKCMLAALTGDYSMFADACEDLKKIEKS